MATHVRSAGIVGVDAIEVDVEADVAQGLPNFTIVGLPDAAVKEARERVRAAFKNNDLPFPRTRVTINLAPADLKKEGPAYDLPIAVALMIEEELLPPLDARPSRLFLGELALDGSVRPVRGALAAGLAAARAGIAELYVPEANAAEAAFAPDVAVHPVRTLTQLLDHLLGKEKIAPIARVAPAPTEAHRASALDLSHIAGQRHAKRALEIAAAGGHNILLSGPPGSGKTMLARALPSILPDMTIEETLEVTLVRSAAGSTVSAPATERPFRSPHHTASGVAIVGGGATPRPGEVSLAHRGILFLDEFPEFPRHVLEHLRQPLEDGVVTISRAHGTVRFPAKFMLVAARNPCPCGYAADPEHECVCTLAQVAAYSKKLSGPLLDRIDLHVEVPKLPPKDLLAPRREEPSSTVRARVATARARQVARLSPFHLFMNAEIPSERVSRLCTLDRESSTLLTTAADRLKLSARAITRVIKLARTIADLDAIDAIEERHVAEALQFRER